MGYDSGQYRGPYSNAVHKSVHIMQSMPARRHPRCRVYCIVRYTAHSLASYTVLLFGGSAFPYPPFSYNYQSLLLLQRKSCLLSSSH